MGHVLARKACIVVPTPAESCVARASKSKLSPAHVRACAVQWSCSPSSNHKHKFWIQDASHARVRDHPAGGSFRGWATRPWEGKLSRALTPFKVNSGP